MLLRIAFLGALSLSTGVLHAQDTELSAAKPIEEAVSQTWSFGVSVVGHLFTRANLDDGPGDVELRRRGVRLGAGRRIGEKRRLGLQARYEQSTFQFGDRGGIGGLVDPFEDLDLYVLSATLRTEESDDFAWMLTSAVSSGSESGADFDDSITFGGGATVSYRVHPKVLFTVGGFGWSRLEDDPLFYPWLQLDWKPSEKLHVGSEGSGYGVGYSWLKDLSAYANFSFVERNYRLDDDASIPDGVVRDDEFALNTGLIWKPKRSFQFELFGGIAFRELTLRDDDGNHFADDNVNPTPYIALSVSYIF